MEPALLDDRAVLAISGPEAREFLQGLVTNDVAGGLAPGTGLYTALLSAQGKILYDFFVTEGDGALLIDCAKDSRDALLKKLKMYKLRARVEIEARDPLAVYSLRSIGATAEMPANLPGPRAYHEARLALGVPEASDFGVEKVFALDAGLEELRGVSFTKGCYIGQELTSRMKHRATTRKRILTITAQMDLPGTGAVTRGGSEIGEILSSHGQTAFALVRLDRLEETQGDITAASIPVTLTRPSWLS